MNAGQYRLFEQAVAQAGGSIRIDAQELVLSLRRPTPKMTVDVEDGFVAVRKQD